MVEEVNYGFSIGDQIADEPFESPITKKRGRPRKKQPPMKEIRTEEVPKDDSSAETSVAQEQFPPLDEAQLIEDVVPTEVIAKQLPRQVVQPPVQTESVPSSIPGLPSSDWDALETSGENYSEVVQSDPEHRVYLLNTRNFDKKKLSLSDLLMKELTISFLPDPEVAFIYAVKMDCTQEWLSMGFTNLAKSRLFRVMSRLQLARSVQGRERVYQGGGTNTSMMLMPPQQERQEYMPMQEEGFQMPKLGGGKGIAGVVGALRNRKGGGKSWWDE